MATYYEYTTLSDVRSTLIGSASTAQDTLITDFIKSTSREIDNISNRHFAPRVQTRNYTPPISGIYDPRMGWASAYGETRGILPFDDDLLAITTLTNGDGSAITSADYVLYPANESAKFGIRLKSTASVIWLPDSAGQYEQVIALLGVWGYHEDYANAYLSAGTIADVAGISASATSYTASASHGIKAGQLLKMESEFVSASAVSSNTITIVRGVNGSTAATHVTATAVSAWTNPSVEMVCRVAVQAQLQLKNNPIGETVSAGGYVFTTPKDVTEYIQQRLMNLGLINTGLG